MPANTYRRAHLHAHLAASTRRCAACRERLGGLLPDCAVCGTPMIVVEPGQVTHPTCAAPA